MANIKTITKKLVNLGFSENKLMMMTEKEIREAYKVAKEESTMKNNTNTTATNNSTTTVVKEEITMTNEMIHVLDTHNRLEQLILVLDWCRIDNVHNAFYVKKDVLAKFLFDKDIIGRQLSKNELKKTKRQGLVDILANAVNNLTKKNTVSVDNFRNDNAPVIEESTFVPIEFNDGLATKILERVIHQADTNKTHNFISDWMLTSIISELIIGLPLKDKGVEHYKTFTDEQKKNLAEIRKAFIKRAKLVAKYNNSKVTGYYIPAKMLVWGRHKYLGVACVYRFMSGNKVAAEYHVSLNGIKNVATGVITALDDNAYATLDSKCVFVM